MCSGHFVASPLSNAPAGPCLERRNAICRAFLEIDCACAVSFALPTTLLPSDAAGVGGMETGVCGTVTAALASEGAGVSGRAEAVTSALVSEGAGVSGRAEAVTSALAGGGAGVSGRCRFCWAGLLVDVALFLLVGACSSSAFAFAFAFAFAWAALEATGDGEVGVELGGAFDPLETLVTFGGGAEPATDAAD